MREYKVVFGKNPMRPKYVYVNANNVVSAIRFVSDKDTARCTILTNKYW